MIINEDFFDDVDSEMVSNSPLNDIEDIKNDGNVLSIVGVEKNNISCDNKNRSKYPMI